MCNLYSLTTMDREILRLFRIQDNRREAFGALPAIFPRARAPVIRRAEDGEREMVGMIWGFTRLQSSKAPKPVTNTRDDQARTNPFWRDSFSKRRCLVPASSFCEPNSDVSPATWNWFALRGDDARPLFAFAGVWRAWNGPIKKDGPNVEQQQYSFMTTLPNSLVGTVNHERMPVLLTREEEFEQWLTGTPDEAFALVKSYDADGMSMVQSGYDKMDLLGASPAGANGRLL